MTGVTANGASCLLPRIAANLAQPNFGPHFRDYRMLRACLSIGNICATANQRRHLYDEPR